MKISVITPSLNQGEFIARTIQSVATQTGGEIEHVIIDGGSSDNTVKILETSTSLKYWVSEQDRGQSHAVNKGIIATDGEIIGWLNSDDIYYPGCIASVLEFFTKNPDVDVIYGMADHLDVNDQPFAPVNTKPFTFERLKNACMICQPALFFRRKLVEKYGLLDETLHYCMDYEYWLRLAQSGVQFTYFEKKLAGDRIYPTNKRLGSKETACREVNLMWEKKFGELSAKYLWVYAKILAEKKINEWTYPKLFHKKVLRIVRTIIFRSMKIRGIQ